MRYIYLILIASLFTFSCNNNNANEEGKSEISKEQFIKLSKDQFEHENMKISNFEKAVFYDKLKANGHISSPPSAKANVNVLIEGTIDNIKINVGDKVEKGEVLATIVSNSLIDLQQSFVKSKVKTKTLKSDYDRISKLYKDNISSKKELNNIESRYYSAKADYESYKLKLELLNLNVKSIEKSDFVSSFSVISPISGTVSKINLNTGDYISTNTSFAEIIDVSELHLVLDIYESDINKVKSGMQLNFHPVNNTNKIYTATISKINKELDKDSKTIKVYAEINEQKEEFYNNSFVKSKILLDTIFANALPQTAVNSTSDNFYAIKYEKKDNEYYYFSKVKLEVGAMNKSNIQVLNFSNKDEFVIEGAYNLF